jgi:hypothetical protein
MTTRAIELIELINVLEGQNVHITAKNDKSYTGHLSIRPVFDPIPHRVLVVGHREDLVNPADVVAIRRV